MHRSTKVLHYLPHRAFIRHNFSAVLLAPLKYPRVWFGVAYAALILVAVLSLMPVPETAVNVSDKVMHFVVYFILSAGFMVLIRHQSNIVKVAIGLVFYGVALEFLQGLTGYRMFEFLDMVANSSGVIVGLMVRVTPAPVWFRMLEAKI